LVRLHFLVIAVPAVLSLAGCGQNESQPQAPASELPAAAAPAAPAAAAPASADTAPLFGRWASDPANCANLAIAISADSFEGAENSCKIASLSDNGDGSFTASLDCASQGQTSSERVAMTPIFGPAGEGVRLSYLDRGGDPVTVFRCPVPRSE
jgi:hypothetical protein